MPLICADPWAPPVTYTVGSEASYPANPSPLAAMSARPVSTSGRTGLPVIAARARADSGSSWVVDGEDTATRAATRARTLLASPRRTVCSCTTRGRRHIPAARPTGTAT